MQHLLPFSLAPAEPVAPGGSDQRGFILYIAIMWMGLLSILALGYASTVRVDTALRGNAARERDGFYAAEAGLNVGMAEFHNIFDDYGVPSGSDFDQRSIMLNKRNVVYQLSQVPSTQLCTNSQADGSCAITLPAGEKFAGLNALVYRYTVNSTALMDGDAEATLGAQFDLNTIPIFQFAAFYANNLEILPGPAMTLNGRVHTNSNLYLNADDSLTIGDSRPEIPNVQVSAAGDIFRRRLDSTSCDGTVIIDKLEDTVAPLNDYDPLTLSCAGSGPISQATIAGYQGSVLANIDPLGIPPVDEIKRDGDGVYWQNADLRIVLRLDQPQVAINFGTVGLCPNGPGALASPALYPIVVQNEDGSQNTTKTTALQKFMCERRGAIFYTDVPTAHAPNGIGTGNDNLGRDLVNYNPNFGGAANGSGPGNEHNPGQDYRVYRRVGEDTNGDGIINNNDSNPDICPASPVGLPVPPDPFWRPSYCPWPNQVALGNEPLWFRDMDYRRGAYYNHREEKYMYLLNVNMRALIEWNKAQGDDPLFAADDTTGGGLAIFLSVQGPDSLAAVNNYGVRVFDSADLDTRNNTFVPGAADPTGLTVVSDQAIYVQGNYNMADKYPAAIIGDSLNVLSQSWERPVINGVTRANDRKSLNDFGDFRTVLTQDAPCGPAGCGGNLSYGINAAFLAGVDDTIGNDYNGGLENYPRFHEDWSGRTLVYRGSFVSLGNPLHVDGQWSYGNPVYEAPGRDWDYDADFNMVSNLPPLSPKVTYLQQKLFTRLYL